ncbi:MAG: hypothetical protein AAGA03_06975 [Planctomycetota bacterium]
MIAVASQSNPAVPHLKRWNLWVDGCGGFTILDGDRWTLGNAGGDADIRIHADCPRDAATLQRVEDDYFLTCEGKRSLCVGGTEIAIPGSARPVFHRPSPLSPTATVQLRPPHRFSGHVDGLVLWAGTLLIGPTSDCHLRVPSLTSRWVITRQQDQGQNTWTIGKVGSSTRAVLAIGVRNNLDQFAVTLEEISS